MKGYIKGLFNDKFIRCLLFVVVAYLAILFFLFLSRCAFFLSNWEAVDAIRGYVKLNYTLTAFWRGLRFDSVIASYISLIPLITIFLFALFKRLNKVVLKVILVYYIVCGFGLLAVSMANIPYYLYFNKHIDTSVFQWFEYFSETFGMVTEESSYLIYILSFVCLFFLYVFLFSSLYKLTVRGGEDKQYNGKDYVVNSVILVFLFLFLVGGTYGFFPGGLKRKHSVFCGEIVLCNAVMNPVFFLTDLPASTKIDRLIDEETAIKNIDKELGFDISKERYIDKTVENDTIMNRPNIVIVYMESFSSKYLETKGKNGDFVTPYIQELKDKSYFFKKFYSQGTHTNQAITATLYSLPAFFDKVMTTKTNMKLDFEKYAMDQFDELRKKSLTLYGLPNELKNQGYYSQMFVTHTKTYENFDYFAVQNEIDKVYGLEDYPDAKPTSVWGISDEDLLKNALEKIDSISKENIPSMTSILTISNHPPYVYLEQYKDISDKEDERAVAYMDDCIKNFMKEASEKEWFNNTIFVFLGDHGRNFSSDLQEYNYPLSLNHVPLIIYSPLFEGMPQHNSSLMGQIDFYPVMMGLLGKTPTYNTFGVDVLSKERKYIYFTSDSKLACMSNDYLYNYDFTYDSEFLYRLDDETYENILEENVAVADSMKNYAASMIRGVKYILKNN